MPVQKRNGIRIHLIPPGPVADGAAAAQHQGHAAVGVGLFSPLLWSMYADVADYATETFGTSSTGLIFSSGTMAQKFGGAVSGSLIALLLGIAGATMIADEMGNESIDPASVTESVRTMIWALFSLFQIADARDAHTRRRRNFIEGDSNCAGLIDNSNDKTD